MNSQIKNRILGIDILRGIVMIIMALDHTRDFFHTTAMTDDPLNPATTNAALFFTRWITHFCAPTFVFLSGLSAYLSSQSKSVSNASIFLLKRGIWLIIVEITLVTFGLTFNPGYNFIILQVIWAIGCSMVVLALLMRLSYKVILYTGLALFFGHNLFNYINLPQASPESIITSILFTTRGSVYPLGSSRMIGDFYAILPWTGIMLLGFSCGRWFTTDFSAIRRRKLLLLTGTSMIVLFILLRLTQFYGDPGVFKSDEHWLYSFLNTSKYPPSLQYSCMTLGPALLLLALFESKRPGWTRPVEVYGRVPFFYYILHFYLLHLVLITLFFASGQSTKNIFDPQSFIGFRPANFGYNLPIVYLIWLSVVALLYLPCRWYNRYKLSHQQWWLKYI